MTGTILARKQAGGKISVRLMPTRTVTTDMFRTVSRDDAEQSPAAREAPVGTRPAVLRPPTRPRVAGLLPRPVVIFLPTWAMPLADGGLLAPSSDHLVNTCMTDASLGCRRTPVKPPRRP
ncbi:hypothetical protein GCM10010221_60430 [Streptomyces parvus]|nr:hypothetical protein GCM10010221_60430 [Streptomyces parvus]